VNWLSAPPIRGTRPSLKDGATEMRNRFRTTDDVSLRRINPVLAFLYMIYGPADCAQSPLRGTRYDSGLRHRRDLERRAARRLRREARQRQAILRSSIR
jgi:hypothetical protein